MIFRALVACVMLMSSAVAAQGEALAPPARASDALRVMTYNIHHGRGADGKIDLPRIAAVIKAADPDVVALQELDVKTKRSGGVDEVAELGRLTGLHASFGMARPFEGGEYGQAILSRRPINKLDVHQLGKVADGSDVEQRIALLAEIDLPSPLPKLLFVGTHLHHKEEKLRLEQSAVLDALLKERIAKGERAVILLGDLNATPESETMKRMKATWDDTTPDNPHSFPAGKPDRKIDYVLLPKGHAWEVVGGKVIDEPVASDHRPVVVDLNWKVK